MALAEREGQRHKAQGNKNRHRAELLTDTGTGKNNRQQVTIDKQKIGHGLNQNTLSLTEFAEDTEKGKNSFGSATLKKINSKNKPYYTTETQSAQRKNLY